MRALMQRHAGLGDTISKKTTRKGESINGNIKYELERRKYGFESCLGFLITLLAIQLERLSSLQLFLVRLQMLLVLSRVVGTRQID
jgi:hypothetical protein